MSIRISCKNCGPRPVEEFVYGEVPVVRPSFLARVQHEAVYV